MTDPVVDLEELNARRAEHYARLRWPLAFSWTLSGAAFSYFIFRQPAPWIRVSLGGLAGLVLSWFLVWIGSKPVSVMPRPRSRLFNWWPLVVINVTTLTILKLTGPASGGWTLPIAFVLLGNAGMFGASKVTRRPPAYDPPVRRRIVIYLAIGAALVVALIAYSVLQNQP